ncbi:MAG: MBL fold metallo-hydrolase [bacterium]
MKLTSYGAVDGVTGSCHVLEIGNKHVMLDCGIFQGGRTAREKNEADFPFDPAKIDVVVISHAHLDHIGRLPLLYKRGFRGRIISTRPSFELARISLLDSAKLLENEAARANRKRERDEPFVSPLYDDEDVLNTLDLWREFKEYKQRFDVVEGLKATYHDAGHILGSTFIELDLSEGSDSRKLIFSGDLGNVGKPIIHDPQTPPHADAVIMESTYGDRDHRPFSESIDELLDAVAETVARRGNVVIPTFALERSQELLYVLYEAWRDGKLPEHAEIYLDSPMAISATRIFERHPDLYDTEAMALHNAGETPFDFPALHYTRETRDSMKINEIRSSAIILAGSGMANGGRVLHHLRHNLGRSECSVVFCGFQGAGTLGRRIVDGADYVSIYGQNVPINAQIHTINGFSAHAGQKELTDWAKATGAKNIFLVHGEDEAKAHLAEHLRKETQTKSVENLRFDAPVDLLKL